jgi:Family of unknown function (DUF6152)
VDAQRGAYRICSRMEPGRPEGNAGPRIITMSWRLSMLAETPLKAASKTFLKTFLAVALLLSLRAIAQAHHSFAIFNQANPVELIGTVEEFRFFNPHTFIVLRVKGEDARPVVWHLEGQSANSLRWSGWSPKSLNPGDQIRITVEPLRSGAPGGSWSASKVRFLNGSPVVSTPEDHTGR